MTIKTVLRILYPAILAFSLLSAPGSIIMTGPVALQAASLPENGVVVYQFHRRFRCEACYKLEEAIKEGLAAHFPGELKSGSLVFRVLDLDQKDNSHYEKVYNFFYNTVIVVDMVNGKETRFKNLEEIWGMVDNKEDVITFIRSEVAEYL